MRVDRTELSARRTHLAKRRHEFQIQGLGRFLAYALGRSPDEFGLLPDPEGFVSIKDLLKAIREDAEWRYVGEIHLKEVLLGPDRARFETAENRIRAVTRDWRLDLDRPLESTPKLLYAAVRRKAHPVVMEKGLESHGHTILTSDREMALRLGTRKDERPVVLEIMASAAQKEGVPFYGFGRLYLASEIPARFISGPPLPKAREETRERKAEGPKPALPSKEFAPGTFFLDPNKDPDLLRRKKGRKRRGWKEEARRMRRG